MASYIIFSRESLYFVLTCWLLFLIFQYVQIKNRDKSPLLSDFVLIIDIVCFLVALFIVLLVQSDGVAAGIIPLAAVCIVFSALN